MVIAGRVYGTMVLDPRLWEVAQEIRCARDGGRSVVALTGAGLSTSSGIPDYVSGTWFRPGIPAKAYSFERFLASFRCRREYWIACDDFRRTAGNARPNLGHRALTEMERNGWLTSTITQNVDGLHQGAGARLVVELHGNITGINCLSCGWTGEWPPEHLWEKYDLHCQSCSGLLKPAVIALGELIPRGAWTAAEKAIENCGVMMVIGSQIAISSAANLVSKARLNHARVVINSIGKVAQAPVPKDVVVAERAEIFLPALAVLLDCPVPSTDKDSNSYARRLLAKA